MDHFSGNGPNLAMCVVAAVLNAAAAIFGSWQIREVIDVISGDSGNTLPFLALDLCAMEALALDRAFPSRLCSRTMGHRPRPWPCGHGHPPHRT